jgi:hypothetical protein
MTDKVPDERARDAAAYVAKHSAALLTPSPTRAGGVHLTGSGALVRLNDRRFVLTATHVWNKLKKHDTIHFTSVPEINHSSTISRHSLKAYSLDESIEEVTPTSPDLTLLELSPIDIGRIEARLTFIPINKDWKARENEIDQHMVLMGAPGVLRKPESGALSFDLLGIFAERDIKEEKVADLGFIIIRPTKHPELDIKDWRGVSGGGLWLVSYFANANGKIDYEPVLVGTAFHQDTESGDRIRCLSRESLNSLLKKHGLGHTA